MPRGTRSVNIEVQAIDDPVREVAEDVVLKMLPGEGYTIGAQMQARVVIPENDENNLPEVEFTLTSSDELESADYAMVHVRLSAPPPEPEDGGDGGGSASFSGTTVRPSFGHASER